MVLNLAALAISVAALVVSMLLTLRQLRLTGLGLRSRPPEPVG